VLELGVVVHSLIIGMSLGASDFPSTVRPLVPALTFHQLFEGISLGGCIVQVSTLLFSDLDWLRSGQSGSFVRKTTAPSIAKVESLALALSRIYQSSNENVAASSSSTIYKKDCLLHVKKILSRI
jgi:hypothetical protein